MAEVPIGPDETADELRGRARRRRARRCSSTRLRAGLGDPAEQVGETTYAEKMSPDELHLDWTAPAIELHRVVRLGEAWTTFRGDG